jgi:hypothetical protein
VVRVLAGGSGLDEFLGAGQGFASSYRPPRRAPTSSDTPPFEGKYEDGKWKPGRRLNGDENDQGNYWRFDARSIKIEKAVLYHYQ